MNVNFNGFGENVATFIADSLVTEAGVLVKMKNNGEVTACASGDNFCGVCVGVRDGYAAVQLSGYVKVGAKSKMVVGYQKLAVSNGKVDVTDNGRELLVIYSDETSAGIIL